MNNYIFFKFYSLAHQSVILDSIIKFLAVDLIYVMLLCAAIFVFIHYKLYNFKDNVKIICDKWKQIIYIPLSAGIAWIVADILKILMKTSRPPAIFSSVHSLFIETGYAFPSGHSATAFALAMAIFFRNKRLGYVFMVGSLLVGVARVAAGVHFPVDIIGGFTIGYLVAFFVKTL